jgi:hypothetical protein
MPGWTAGLGVGPRQLGFAQVSVSLFFSTLFLLFYFLYSVLLFLIQVCHFILQVLN